MKKQLCLCLSLLLLVSLWGCGKQPHLTNLGIPTADSYYDFQSASRNPWDMALWEGKLYVGCGDWNRNTGPVDIWAYDLKDQTWAVSGTVRDEAVSRFCQVNGELTAPGIDPQSSWQMGNYYVLRNATWETVRSVPDGVHMFDIVEFDGAVFYGIGTPGEGVSPVQVTRDGGETFQGVPFYGRFGNVMFTAKNQHYRVYDLVVMVGRLYAVTSVYDAVFRYDNGAFYYVTGKNYLELSDRQCEMYEKVVLNGCCYFTTGTFYKTEDFETVTKLTLPDGGKAEDLLLDGRTLYVLGSKKAEDGSYTNTIWKLRRNGDWKKVYAFSYELCAMSFAKNGRDFFVGIGRYDDDPKAHPAAGTILYVDR